MERKIIDNDGVLTMTLEPLDKGGPGSGRYPAGSGAGGRSKGGGGGGASQRVTELKEQVESLNAQKKDLMIRSNEAFEAGDTDTAKQLSDKANSLDDKIVDAESEYADEVKSIPVDPKIKSSIVNAKTVKEYKSAVSNLGGEGDKRIPAAAALEQTGHRYEATYGNTELYISSKFNVEVTYEGNRTTVAVSQP